MTTCPEGVFRGGFERQAFVVMLDRRAYSIRDGRLHILGLGPIPLLEECNLEGTTSLLLAATPAYVTVRLKYPPAASEYRPSKGKQVKTRKGLPRMHHEAAKFMTGKVRPKVMSGGLPSLGKKR